jgi:hypothetical protein
LFSRKQKRDYALSRDEIVELSFSIYSVLITICLLVDEREAFAQTHSRIRPTTRCYLAEQNHTTKFIDLIKSVARKMRRTANDRLQIFSRLLNRNNYDDGRCDTMAALMMWA